MGDHFFLTLWGISHLRDARGTTYTLATQKNRLLIAVLACQREGWMARNTLAETVWPDVPPEAARKSLRNALSRIRAMLDAEVFEIDGDSVRLRPGLIGTDIDSLPMSPETDFMEGFDADWVVEKRLSLRTEAGRQLAQAATKEMEAGNLPYAQTLAKKAMGFDPYESDYVALKQSILVKQEKLAEAEIAGTRYRSKVLRDLGVLVPQDNPAEGTDSSHPLLTTVQWLLERNPESAVECLASCDSTWTSINLEASLIIHRGALKHAKKESLAKARVENRYYYLNWMAGKFREFLPEAEKAYLASREGKQGDLSFYLAAALAYSYLSSGEFKRALQVARQAVEDAYSYDSLSFRADCELTLAIMEQHCSGTASAFERMKRGFQLAQETSDVNRIGSAAICLGDAHLDMGSYSTGLELLEQATRIATLQLIERYSGWVEVSKAKLAYHSGDLHLARDYANKVVARGTSAVGHSAVNMALDRLTLIDCKMREYESAAESFVSSHHMRKRVGSVASIYEKSYTTPAVRILKQRLGIERLRNIHVTRFVASATAI